jgi:hypothetical protein
MTLGKRPLKHTIRTSPKLGPISSLTQSISMVIRLASAQNTNKPLWAARTSGISSAPGREASREVPEQEIMTRPRRRGH